MSERLDGITQVIEQAEEQIAAGEVERALRLARAAGAFPDPDDVLLQLLARWNTAEREMLENLISDDDHKVERAQVTKRLAQFLQAIRRQVEWEKEALAKGTAVAEDGEAWILPDYAGKPQLLLLYALEDELLLEQLRKHLFLAMRDEALQFVDVHRAVPLSVQNKAAYQQQLVTVARSVLALVSPNAMSEPIFSLAEQALAAGKLIPIRVEEIGLEGSPFREEIKGLPHDGRFVSDWPNRNRAWVKIAQALQAFFNQIKEQA